MFGEEGFYQELTTRLLDAYTLDEILEISEADPHDILFDLLVSRQLILNLEDFEDINYDDANA